MKTDALIPVFGELGENAPEKFAALVRSHASLYAMGDTSLRSDTAQELVTSVAFSLSLYFRSYGAERFIREADWGDILSDSQALIAEMIKDAKRLFFTVRAAAPAVTSRAWRDTVVSVGGFFTSYDLRFFAHMIPASIDYPLARPVSEDTPGIEYIREYLTRLAAEGRFLKKFPQSALYAAANDTVDFDESLDNLYLLVLQRALCTELCSPDTSFADAYTAARIKLAGIKKEEFIPLLGSAASSLCLRLFLDAPADADYLRLCAAGLAPYLFASLLHG